MLVCLLYYNIIVFLFSIKVYFRKFVCLKLCYFLPMNLWNWVLITSNSFWHGAMILVWYRANSSLSCWQRHSHVSQICMSQVMLFSTNDSVELGANYRPFFWHAAMTLVWYRANHSLSHWWRHSHGQKNHFLGLFKI